MMRNVFISSEEQEIIDEYDLMCEAKHFLALARQHPKSVILTYYRAMFAATGAGMAKNPALAKRWLRRIFPSIREAALRGDPAAQNCMGNLYNEKKVAGFVVPYDCEEALRWFRKSARHGFARAQLNIALAYFKGLGVKKSRVRAAKWLDRAARHGSPVGTAVLANCYSVGWGVEQDHVREWILYTRAAEMGLPLAQYRVGLGYWHGFNGHIIDLKKAQHWLRKSANTGLPSAIEDLKRLESELRKSIHTDP